jgi:hypothetical protein
MSLQDLFGAPVRYRLVPEYSGVGRARIDARWDNSRVLALQEPEDRKWERATNALARGGITRNMFLSTVGLDPVPGGDVFLTPAGVTPTPASDQAAGDLEGDEPELPAEPAALRAAAYGAEFLNRLQAKAANEPGRDLADASANGHRPTDAITTGGSP